MSERGYRIAFVILSTLTVASCANTLYGWVVYGF